MPSVIATEEAVYFINGVVKVDGRDVATIQEVDSMVSLEIVQEQKTFKGSHVTPISSHTIGFDGKIKISRPIFHKDQLDKLLGLDKATATLSDAVTAATVYSASLSDFFNRPEVELLIQGTVAKTGEVIEIAADKAVMVNNFLLELKKDDFTMPELEFICLGDKSDLTAPPFTIAIED